MAAVRETGAVDVPASGDPLTAIARATGTCRTVSAMGPWRLLALMPLVGRHGGDRRRRQDRGHGTHAKWTRDNGSFALR